MKTLFSSSSFIKPLVFILSIIALTACKEGDDGKAGKAGLNTLVDVTDVTDILVCANGGKLIQMGADINYNNVLDDDEVTDEESVCNGIDGKDITVTTAAIEDCPVGGYEVFENGVSLGFICSGADGTDGTDISVSIADVADCPNGGYEIFADEVSQGFVCSGADGTNGTNLSVSIADVADCPNGGFEVLADGVSQGFVCTGADGTDGTDLTVSIADVADCPNGGFEIFADGVSQGFVCTGADGTDGTDGSVLRLYVDANDVNCDDAQAGTIAIPNCEIQAAIFHARSGNSILVAAGNYGPIYIYKELSIFGGYDSSSWIQNSRVNITTINDGGVISTNPTVDIASPGTHLDGFKIDRTTLSPGNYMMGVTISESATLSNNIITVGGVLVNAVTAYSYGVYALNAKMIIGYNNIINVGSTENERNIGVEYGSGIASIWFNNKIIANNSWEQSVGLSVSGGRNYIANNTILVGNVRLGYGYARGISINGAILSDIVNNNIYVGTALNRFAIYMQPNTSPDSINLVHNNFYGSNGPMIYLPSNVTTNTMSDINGCTVWLSSEGCGSETAGNTYVNPLFVDFNNGDYRLQSGSPLVNAGVEPSQHNHTFFNVLNYTIDLDGNTRDAFPDVGAYEYIAP